MVFSSSHQVYSDPPNLLQQQVQNQEPPGAGRGNPPPPEVRPGSMTGKLDHHQGAALKCPRCDSPNTKFCYFNNYSLSQPRHFCKTCRRYWTRGGALRNVPVGGGCRPRNKRSATTKRSTRSKSPSAAAAATTTTSTDTVLPFHPSLHHLISDFGGIGDHHHLGLNFNGTADVEFQMGSCSLGGAAAARVTDPQWRLQQLQQFQFLAGMDSSSPLSSNLYQFEGIGSGGKQSDDVGLMKVEENGGLNLSRNYMGNNIHDHDQYWGGNPWTDLSAFTTPSSTSHLF